jgi:hypothetical protein
LINLNVTSVTSEEAQLVIDLRVNHRNPSRIAQSLERYGYTVLALDEEAMLDDATIRSRFDQLMFLLDL